MTRRSVLALLAALAVSGLAMADAPLCGTAYAASCCKTCTKGKACGDSCIAADRKCTKPRGCACNG